MRPLLSNEKIAPEASRAITAFHADVVAQVGTTIASEPVVVVGMAQNVVVKRARRILTEAGIPFTYLEYGSYFSQWKKRLAIKLWSGWPTFPQVFVKGTLVGGASETAAALADGSFKARLG